uniref:hypothetical protein n=1 Tax=uncultured Caulobacter sp. TaxID=158749 RepID=UPI0025CF113F|nr:hypothetical protein [uncultured Caulobacter sp.]
MSEEVHVYELIDPRDGKRFYIGITDNEKRRLNEHEGRQCPSTRETVDELLTLGLRPKMVRLATCVSRAIAEEIEIALQDLNRKRPQRWPKRLRPTPLRQGAAWSKAEDIKLRNDRDSGKTVREMAASFNRSRGSITSRLLKMSRAEPPNA